MKRLLIVFVLLVLVSNTASASLLGRTLNNLTKSQDVYVDLGCPEALDPALGGNATLQDVADLLFWGRRTGCTAPSSH